MIFIKNCLRIFLVSVCWPINGFTYQEYGQQFAENPQKYELLYNASVEAARIKDYQVAFEYSSCLSGLCESDPTMEKAFSPEQGEQLWYNQGNIAFQVKKYEEALRAFEKVVNYNPHNERAHKKIEYLKQLLEQQKQEQEQKKQDKQDQSQENNENKNEEKKEQNDQPQDQQKKEKQDQQNSEKKENSEKTQEQEPQKEQKDAAEQQSEKQKEDTVDLTEQEKQILAAVQDLDERMHESMEVQKLKKAQGGLHARNNW